MSVPFFPLMGFGFVLSHDVQNHGVHVMLQSGQMPTGSVKVGFDGPADGLRINMQPLPTKGTWGVIVFPNHDPRNGIWIKSFYTQNVDAITSDIDPHATYTSEWSGYWKLRDNEGNESQVFPDGSSFTFSTSGTVPLTYQHIVNSAQQQVRQELTQQARVPNPPKPFIFNFQHASGTNVTVDSSGNTTVNGAADATLTFKFGNTVLIIDSDGNASWNVNKACTLTAPSGMTINANTQINGNLQVSGTIADHNNAYGTVNAIRVVYNGHTHEGVNGQTSVPNQLMP